MKKNIYLLFLSLLTCTACDYVAEDERLIAVEKAQAKRVVLLEDFTGQLCVNCPLGTEKIEQLLTEYGDHVVAVGIHGGPLGYKGNANNIGLATELGDNYFRYWNLEYQPIGLVNRHGAVNYSDWTKCVTEELAKDSPLQMELSARRDGDQIAITVKETALSSDVTGKVQVWVLEDSIQAVQFMPDGSRDREYIHNHVLRKEVNGMWGEEVKIALSDTEEQTYEQEIDAAWNVAHLSIVAFVYNQEGVVQVVKSKVE